VVFVSVKINVPVQNVSLKILSKCERQTITTNVLSIHFLFRSNQLAQINQEAK